MLDEYVEGKLCSAVAQWLQHHPLSVENQTESCAACQTIQMAHYFTLYYCTSLSLRNT